VREISVSMHATARDEGKVIECVVRCGDRHAKVTFTPDDIITEVLESQAHGEVRLAAGPPG